MSVPPSVKAVLETLRRHGVRSLLMGGQACVSYGASEFTRDLDLVVLSDSDNLDLLRAAMAELQAEVIAVPPFDPELLKAGHAVHFRCRAEAVAGLRVDIMSRLRGVDDFDELWTRRVELSDGVFVVALPDLVAAKKTQRDKDWPMIRRLIEADYFARRDSATGTDAGFWLRECRSSALIRALVARFPTEASALARGAIRAACSGGSDSEIDRALRIEEEAERAIDAEYWAPLKRELEELRSRRARANDPSQPPPA